LTTVISVPNPLDTSGVVCSSPLDICDPDSVDVDFKFGSVLRVLPELVPLVELRMVFGLTVVGSPGDLLDTIGVVCSSTVNHPDVDSVELNDEFCHALVVIAILNSLIELVVVFWMAPVISEPYTLDTIGVVCSSPLGICDVDFVDVEFEVCCVFVTIPAVV
jgi:hypothetical protein